MQAKKSIIAGAAIATIGLTGVATTAFAAADTATDTTKTSLVDKIATKFNLNKDEVQAVFDENREERHAAMEAKRTETLAQLVSDGKLTQAQADHVTSVWEEMKTLHDGTSPRDMTEAQREAMKTKMDEFKTWLDEQGLDLHDLGVGMGPGGKGGHGRGQHHEAM